MAELRLLQGESSFMTEQEDQLNQLEQRIIRAWLDNDRETVNAILADDWTVIDPSGRVLTKAQVMVVASQATLIA